jgi:hypothetical protein
MKKSVMQSTIKVEGVYGVEIGDYAVILSDGQVIRKPFPEEWEVVSDQNDGKIPVDEFSLETAEMYNFHGEFLSDVSNEEDGESSPTDESEGLFLGYSEQDEQESPPSNITLTATMKYEDTLGWEFFPGMYLLENGRITSRIPEEKIELSEEEFSVPMMDYITAKDTANKLEIVEKSKELGQGGYID